MNLFAVCFYIIGGDRDGENVIVFVNSFSEAHAEDSAWEEIKRDSAESYQLMAIAPVPLSLVKE